MTIRTGILTHSPLTHVIASVRFAPWARIPSKIAEIQDEMRDIAPLMNTIQIEQMGPNPLNPVKSDAWMLMSSDKSYCFQFANDQLLMFTTKYTRFDDFIGKYEKALSVLLSHMRFVDVLNMGVRYVDKITAKPDEHISSYISKAWLPPQLSEHTSVGGTILGEYRKGDSRLRVSAQSMPGALPIPHDVLGLIMMTQQPHTEFKLLGTGPNELILDMDAVALFESPRRMEKSLVLAGLKSLHDLANDFFRHPDVLTDHAFRTWKGEA
ncbi:TIGR04255 family protein [Pseudomonas sp. NFACC49-2]|uniref:TIGR04255 family protein n=1 Tax=Pseudomonas sp. NFACC49-2 TaxID=1566222 RepID=UPI0009246BF8|nr:TIGR04255 family protein [Pseudomonas sp. NFACC49-2]SFY19856.1 TIGR04255 family protein [Pseudomonas sp. NFACC49-2]